jgi:tight adherence protein C
MTLSPQLAALFVFAVVFTGIGMLGYFLTVRAVGVERRALFRLRELGAPVPTEPARTMDWASQALPRLGALAASTQKAHLATLRNKLLYAGYFRADAPLIFLGVKLLLVLVLPLGAALVGFFLPPVTWQKVACLAAAGCVVGMFGPYVWLSWKVNRRQGQLRTAIPDALDLLVLCLEGGISFGAAVQRVTDELQVVHPVLGLEMNIVQREMQLGLSAGDALRKFADRCGLADVRDLALVLLQSERFGASVAKALRTFTDAARTERQQRAEEMAQKAAVKVLFPTLLCIFPAIFIVLLGPAAYQISRLFAR